jgi:hypothetical protein
MDIKRLGMVEDRVVESIYIYTVRPKRGNWRKLV